MILCQLISPPYHKKGWALKVGMSHAFDFVTIWWVSNSQTFLTPNSS